jgi:hypothetical protein
MHMGRNARKRTSTYIYNINLHLYIHVYHYCYPYIQYYKVHLLNIYLISNLHKFKGIITIAVSTKPTDILFPFNLLY